MLAFLLALRAPPAARPEARLFAIRTTITAAPFTYLADINRGRGR
jgi:hypothetical protein